MKAHGYYSKTLPPFFLRIFSIVTIRATESTRINVKVLPVGRPVVALRPTVLPAASLLANAPKEVLSPFLAVARRPLKALPLPLVVRVGAHVLGGTTTTIDGPRRPSVGTGGALGPRRDRLANVGVGTTLLVPGRRPAALVPTTVVVTIAALLRAPMGVLPAPVVPKASKGNN